MKIVKLNAENILRLTAVEITPEGDVIKITGRNGAGKSSVLNSILYALGGKDAIPAKPIREGQKKGKVTLDLGDIVVERRFTAQEDGGYASTVTITSKDGAKYKSPQNMLDGLIGRLSFDPLEYMRMKPADKFETLRDLVGLDFTKLEDERKTLYDQRTEVNREGKQKAAQLESIEFDPDGATEEQSAGELIADLDQARQAAEAVKAANKRLLDVQERIDELEKELAGLYDQLPTLQKAAEAKAPDVDAIKAKLDNLEDANKNARAYQQHKSLKAEVDELRQKSAELTHKIEGIDEHKKSLISSADMPVDGLDFGDDTVLYNGLPLEQASSAEQLRVSLGMAMAMNPELRVVRITDGSLLDSESMKIVEQMAGKHDYQIWMETVSDGDGIGIVIEDGAVRA